MLAILQSPRSFPFQLVVVCQVNPSKNPITLNGVSVLRIGPFFNVYYLEWVNAPMARRPKPTVLFDLTQRDDGDETSGLINLLERRVEADHKGDEGHRRWTVAFVGIYISTVCII